MKAGATKKETIRTVARPPPESPSLRGSFIAFLSAISERGPSERHIIRPVHYMNRRVAGPQVCDQPACARGPEAAGRRSPPKHTASVPNRTPRRPTPPLAPAMEEDEAEKSCGPTGFWEALTPCNGCRNLGFSSLSPDSKHSAEIITSPSLDVFLPEDEDNPYESVTTAVTRKPCSLDINHRLNTSPRNGHLSHVTESEGEHGNHDNCSTGPTPDCSPPSPDTALKNIERVIRPQ
ncbi:ankyrin repeat and sterile alpha motif domain-containing protein 1B isoform X1, partial [Lates japonicus]